MASTIETKIGRISTAVTSALSALTAKGVTVPEGANVESLAALIEGIEAGGGGTKMITGSFTLASDATGTIYIEQDISSLALDGEDLDTTKRKLCLFVSLDLPENIRGAYGFAYFNISDTIGASVSIGYDGSSTNYKTYSSSCYIYSDRIMLRFGTQDSNIGPAGNTYKYYIWRVRE